MTLESFKKINKDRKPFERLYLLVETTEQKGANRVHLAKAETKEDRDYYHGEIEAMNDRIDWLYETLLADLNKEDEGFRYRDPEKTQKYRETWSSKSTEGMVYISDIRHAISNSDQYPYPLWKKDHMHLAAQEAQEKTLRAVIAAIDRVPVYERDVRHVLISKVALVSYLVGKMTEYPGLYDTAAMLRDISDFQIDRDKVEE